MYDRELFNGTMHYGDFDRMPVFHRTGRVDDEGMSLNNLLTEE